MTPTITRAQELLIPEARDYLISVDGAWVESLDGAWINVTTPILREHVIARVPASSAADVDRAVTAARTAFPAWSSQHFTGQQRVLAEIADAVECRSEEWLD